MAHKKWTFSLDGKERSIELEHRWLSGARIIKLDGEIVFKQAFDGKDTGSEHVVKIDSHVCIILIKLSGFGFAFDLYLDGRSMENGAKYCNQDTPINEIELGYQLRFPLVENSSALIERWAKLYKYKTNPLSISNKFYCEKKSKIHSFFVTIHFEITEKEILLAAWMNVPRGHPFLIDLNCFFTSVPAWVAKNDIRKFIELMPSRIAE